VFRKKSSLRTNSCGETRKKRPPDEKPAEGEVVGEKLSGLQTSRRIKAEGMPVPTLGLQGRKENSPEERQPRKGDL